MACERLCLQVAKNDQHIYVCNAEHSGAAIPKEAAAHYSSFTAAKSFEDYQHRHTNTENEIQQKEKESLVSCVKRRGAAQIKSRRRLRWFQSVDVFSM